MKTKTNILAALVIIFLVSVRCDQGKPVDVSEVNMGILSSHNWNLQKLTVDDVDKTSMYVGMTLSFTGTTYTTTKGAPVWPLSGTWSFTGSDGVHIVRNDQVAVTIDQISESQLVLSLTWNQNTLGGGRASSVSGKHVYAFIK